MSFKSSLAAQLALGLTIVFGGLSACEAAGKRNGPPRYFDDLMTPSMLAAPAAAAARTSSAGVRFFSINSVLAKLDGKAPPSPNIRVAAIGSEAVLSDAPRETMPAATFRDGSPASSSEPFGLVTFRAPDGILWRKWRDAQAALAADLDDVARCKADRNQCSEAAYRFMMMLADVQARNGSAQIETANRLVNGAIRYVSDLNQHGELDVWSSPLAALGNRRGDCEDYAIAKYALLREAGFHDNDLRILLVRDRAVRDDHAVLAVRHAGTWLVLDNRRSALATAAELAHFTPLYALNDRGIQLFASPYLAQRLNADPKIVSPASEAAPVDANVTSIDAPIGAYDNGTAPITAGSSATGLPLLL